MRRRLLILLAALVLAGISGVAVLSYARTADRRALSGKEGTWILVAKQYIPAGTSGAEIRTRGLTERLLVPTVTVPTGALNTWDGALDRLQLGADLQPKQMIMQTLFVQVQPSPSHTGRIPVPRKSLAVSVSLNVAPQVAGNITPGDQVAVYYTFQVKVLMDKDKETIPMTELLLPKARVITIGEATKLPQATTTPSSAPAGVSPTPGPSVSGTGGAVAGNVNQALSSNGTNVGEAVQRYVVTLAVDDTDALRLVHAVQSGQLYLALLGPNATASTGPAVDTSWVVN
ncbi:RcpC/CpaB family pilus assembly protein [Actinoplanes sp. HUAS TT8]|uniref:RcpC/CpaB family pilus assembly protein n=1 Tax=Actinoplanes sp. HUAS TT8 TaxID=3447453 RepID=UPI003F528B9E